MQVPKLIKIAAIFLISLWVLSFAFGLEMFASATMIIGAIVVVVLHIMKVIKIDFLSKGNKGMYALVGLVVVGFFMGAFAGIPFLEGILTPAAFTGSTTQPVGTMTATSCAAGLSDEVRGQAATVYLEGYDQESNTPYSSNGIGNVNYYYQIVDNNGNEGAIKTSKGGETISNVAGGNVVRLWEKADNQSTYYMDPVEVCVDQLKKTIEVDIHAPAAQSNMQVTGYDKTGSAALSAGTKSGQEDYDITIGANGEEPFYLEFTTNAANKAFRLGAVAIRTDNDIDDVTPQDGVWTETIVADFLDCKIANDTAGTYNVTGYEKVYELNTPIMMSEWDDVKYKFTFEAGTTDPTTQNAKWSDDDHAIICFLDVGWSRSDDGRMNLGYYQDTTSQPDVGVAEDYVYPVGKTTCTVIEGI